MINYCFQVYEYRNVHKIHFSSTLTVRERNKTEHPKNVNNSLIARVSSSCIGDS